MPWLSKSFAQAKVDIRARVKSEEQRAKDLKTLDTLERLRPGAWDSSDDGPEKKKQRA